MKIMRSSRLMVIKKKQALEESNAQGFNSEKRNPHFFKVIVSPLSQKSNLKIPQEFVKKYGEQLSDVIYLDVPNSEQPWKVGLQKENNAMSLGNGLQDFMEFYSLDYGHFLVFRLDGGLPSHFHVLILDKSGTEIDYPARSSRVPKRSADSRLQVEMDVTEDHNHHTDSVINLDTSDSDDDDDIESLSFKSKGNNHEISPEKRKKNLKEKLNHLKSQHPHFTSIMCPSHIHHKYHLSVPFKSHALTYFPRAKSEKIILKGPTGKRHPVRFYFGKKHAQFLSGWKNFVLDNDLKVGDACMFELVSRKPNFYIVSIYRS